MITTEQGTQAPKPSQEAVSPVLVIRTKEEVAALFRDLYKPPAIATAQGGGAMRVSYGGGSSIEIRRGSAAQVRRSTHSLR